MGWRFMAPVDSIRYRRLLVFKIFGAPQVAADLQISQADFQATHFLVIIFSSLAPEISALEEEIQELVLGAFKRFIGHIRVLILTLILTGDFRESRNIYCMNYF